MSYIYSWITGKPEVEPQRAGRAQKAASGKSPFQCPPSQFLANVWFAEHSGVDAMFVNTSAFIRTDEELSASNSGIRRPP